MRLPRVSIFTSLLGLVALLVLATSGTILAASYLTGSRQAVEGQSRAVVVQANHLARQSLRASIAGVNRNLRVAAAWGESGQLDVHDARALNARFQPILAAHPWITSMLLADERGHEWMLLETEGGWVNRLSRPDEWGRSTRWLRWSGKGELLEESTRDLDYDARKRPWFRGAIGAERDGELHWTEPYTFFTTKDPGITASTRFTAAGRRHVVAFDVLLLDVTRSTLSTTVGDSGAVAVLEAASGRVVGMPRGSLAGRSRDVRQLVLTPVDELGFAPLTVAWHQRHAEPERAAFRYAVDGSMWWALAEPIQLGSDRAFSVVTLVPERDFEPMLEHWRSTVLVVTLGALAVAFLFAAAAARRYSTPLRTLARESRRIRRIVEAADSDDSGTGSSAAELSLKDIPSSRVVEIDTLVENFGEMADRLAAKSVDLERANATLERRVEARTRDLAARNDELQQALAQLREMQAQLVMQEKMASLGALVAGVAHEVNNPIGAVSAAARNVEICVDKLKSSPHSEHARILSLLLRNNAVISEGSSRVAQIVRSLRSFSRLDEAEYQECDLHDGLESTLTLVRHLLADRVAVQRRYGALPKVFCVPGQLNQVFMNLIVNAIQAIERDGTVTLETRSDGESVTVSVSDTGSGISAENLSKVFDPGFTTKGAGVGTGLGLSISYRIVRSHGGTIDVESEPGSGARFTVRLPIDSRKSARVDAA